LYIRLTQAYKIRASGGSVRHELYKDMVHNFQVAPVLAEGRLAIQRINQFLAEVFEHAEEVKLSESEGRMCIINSHERL
jgi:hypothetical protein